MFAVAALTRSADAALARQSNLCASRTDFSSFVSECEPGTLVPGVSKRSGIDVEVIGVLRGSPVDPGGPTRPDLHLRQIPRPGRGEVRGP
jgi:hypothetical protein